MKTIKETINKSMKECRKKNLCSASRVLRFYTTIKLGGRIYKKDFMEEHSISQKTFTRDKAKVEDHLSEYYKVTIELYFNKKYNYYELVT